MSTDRPNPYEPSQTDLVAEPEGAAGAEPVLASRLNRLGARIIDGIIGIIVTVPIMFVTGYFTRTMQQQVGLAETALYTVVGIVIYVAIHGYLLATRGQTVGKMLAGIRIVDHQTGELLPVVKLIGLRDIPVALISVIPIVGALINFVNVLFIFGSKRRCLHDLIAGTRVVNAK